MAEDLSRGAEQGNHADTGASAPGGATDSQVAVQPAGAPSGSAAPQVAADQGHANGTIDHGGGNAPADQAAGVTAPVGQDHAADAGGAAQQSWAARYEPTPGAIGPGGGDGNEVVARPQAGETMIYNVTPGEHLAIQFDPDAAIFRIAGDDFVLNFGDGGRVVLADFVEAAQSGHPPVLDIGGQQVAADALLNQALAFNEGLQFPETAGGPSLLGSGGTYSDDLGNLIDLLNPLGVIPPVSMNFGLIALEPLGLTEENGHPGITVTTETPTPPITPPDHNPPTPGSNPPPVTFHGGGFEDAEPNQHIGDTSVHPTQIVVDFLPSGNEVLQTLTISGIPAGSTLFAGGTDAAHIVAVTNGSVTLTAAQVNSGIFMIPPHDSDQDIPLHVTGHYSHPTGDVSADTTFVVDAAADQPTNVSGTPDHPVVQEGHPVTVAVHASFGDYTDGSETHYVLVQLQSGWTNTAGYATETITTPNAFGVPAGTYVRVPVDNSVITAGHGSVTVDVTLGAPDHVGAAQAAAASGFSTLAATNDPSVSQTYHLAVVGKAVESTLSGSELTTDNNVSYGPNGASFVDITVLHPGGHITVTTETDTPPVHPTGDVPGGSTHEGTPPTDNGNGTVKFEGGGFEDGEPNQHVGDTSLHPIHIIPTFEGASDEVLTSLTISGIPSGATFLVGGQDLAHAVTVTDGSITLTPAQVASGIYMIPPHDSDADIPLGVSGTFREPQTGATGTVTGTTTAIVDAVADKPTAVSGAADHNAVKEGAAVTFTVHATFGDHVDGSESHFALVQLDAGWTNTAGYATETFAAGNTFGVPAGTYVVVPVDNATIGANGVGTATVTLTSPGHITGNEQSYDFNIVGKAQETKLSGSELTTDNNVSYTPAPTPVHVKVIHPGAEITVTTETNTPPVHPTGDVPGGSTHEGTPPTPETNGTVTFHGGGFEDAEPNQHVGDLSVHPIQILTDFTPATDETLTSLTISGIPSGATFLVGGADLAHAVTVTDGSITLTPAQVASGIYMIPPHDSDADIPLGVSGSFTEPQTGATGTVTGTTTAIVDAVADKPTAVSGAADHNAVKEGAAVTFTVHATFGDHVDGSESHFALVQLDAGWTNTAGYATETFAAGNTFGVPAGTYVVVPVDNATIGANGVGTATVTLTSPGHITGNEQSYDFNIVGKAQETKLSGSELTTDNNVSYTPAPTPVHVKVIHPGAEITVTTETNTPPVHPTGDVPGGSTHEGTPPTPETNGTVTFHGGGFEDAEPNQHVGDLSVHPIQILTDFTPATDETLTSLTISGIPSGATFLVGGADLAHAVTVTDGSITLTPAQVASGIYMIPPHDSDADIPLSVSGSFTEPQTGATGTVTGTTTAIVDAVADKPTAVSGAADHNAVKEGAAVTFTVHATFGDHVDGSESHFALVQLDAGWTNTAGYATETFAAGNTFGVPAGTYVVVPVDNATIGANGVGTATVTLTSPGHITGNEQSYDFNIVGKAQETKLSGSELTTDNNVSYTPAPTPVHVKVIHPGAEITVTTETNTPPVHPTGDVPGGSTHEGTPPTPETNGTVTFHGGGFEDAEPNQHVGDLSVHPIQILTDFTPATDETLTSLTISGIPSGATFLVGGADLAHAVTVTDGSITLTPAQVASGIYMIPPHDSDADIPLSVSGSFTEPQTGATGTVTGTTTAIVDAVADKPTAVSGAADHSTVAEGHAVTITAHATFGDFTDGSESHSVLVEIPTGWGNPDGLATETFSAGNTFGVPAGTYVVVPVANATIGANGAVSVDVHLTAPGTVDGSATYDLTVVGKAQETVLSGGELTTDNNVSYTPSPTPVEVKVSEPPEANPGHDTVYEAGLPDGTDPTSGHDHATGYLSANFHGSEGGSTGNAGGGGSVTGFVSQDGLTVTETATSFVVNDGTFLLTIDKATGDYAATLLQNTLDHTGVNLANDQDVITHNFTYTVTNADGLTSSSTWTLNIADDKPEAYNDTNSVHKGGTTTGNVMTNDQQGADHATVTEIGTHAVAANGDTVVAGTYGTLTIHADGTYSYTADHANQGGTLVDHFTYQITDLEGAHGDSATANLDITIDNALPTGADDSATVREAAINGTAVFAAGSDPASGAETATGTLHYNFGADHAATANGGFAWSGAVTAADGDANGTFNGLTSGGDAVQFRVSADGHTITGFVPDSAAGPYAGHDVLTLTVDPATGHYTYQQLGPIDHPDSAATVGGLGETEAQDPVDLHFGYTVTDSDGDTAQGHLSVAVLDDGPKAANDSFNVVEPTGKDTKLVYVIDVSNSMNTELSDGTTKLDAAKEAFTALNQQAVDAGLGNSEVLVVAFNGSVQHVMQFEHANDPSITTAIDGLTATDGTSYEPAFNVVSDWLGGHAVDSSIPGAAGLTTELRAGADTDSRVFFLSDGGNNNSAGGWDPSYGNVDALYGNVGNSADDLFNVTIKSVGFGLGTTSSAYPVLDLTDNNVADHSAQTVDTSAGASGIQGAFGQVLPEGTVTGNVLTNDHFGADGKGGITAITVDGVTYNADGTVSTTADHPGGHLVSDTNGVLVVQTDLGGTLTFHYATGDFSYQAPDHLTSATQSESFTYTIKDADGDLSRADLGIAIQHQPPQAHNDTATVTAGEAKTGKLVYVIDTSESMGHPLSTGTKLDAAKQAFETLNQQAIAAGFAGSEVLIVAFNNGVQSVMQFDHATDTAISSYIDSLSATGGTHYEPALGVVSDWLAGTGIDQHITGADTTTTAVRNGESFDDRVFFLTDGGNNNSAGGFDPSHGSLDNLYSNVGSLSSDLHNVTVKTVGFGLDHNSRFYGDLDRTDDNIHNGSAITVDTQGGATAIVGGFGTITTDQMAHGNVLVNDSVGHDGPGHIVSFTADGLTFTATSAVGGEVVSNDHGIITIHTKLGGDFQFNFNTGDYTYHAPTSDLANPGSEVFHYTLADATGATGSANLTIAVEPSANGNGGFENGTLNDWAAAGSVYVTPDAHSGSYAAMLNTNNDGPNTTHYSASDIGGFLGANASDLAHLSAQDVTNGAAMKTVLTVDAHNGNDITFDYNFLTDEGSAGSTNDLAFAEVNGKLYLLADAHNTAGTLAPTNTISQDGFERSTGWHTATVHLDQSASQSGHVQVAFGVMNAGVNGVLGHDSGLQIDNVHAAAAHAGA